MLRGARTLHICLFATVIAASAVISGGCIGRSGGIETAQRAAAVDVEPTADPTLESAQELIVRGRGGQAFNRLVEWFEAHEESADGYDQALYLAAIALIEDGRRIYAFYYLEELLDNHPASAYYRPAVDLQYTIATSYLEGNADRTLIFPERHYDEAIEMLFRIQLRLPGSELAETALLDTADFYFQQGDFDFAEDAYFVFIDRFPRSPQVPLARLKQAFSNLKQYQGPAYDPTPLIDARTQLLQFRNAYPDLARQQNLNRLLEWIDEEFAQKLLIQASYYARTGEPEAQQLLLARIIDEHPGTEAGEIARRRLKGAALPATRPTADPDPVPEPSQPGGTG